MYPCDATGSVTLHACNLAPSHDASLAELSSPHCALWVATEEVANTYACVVTHDTTELSANDWTVTPAHPGSQVTLAPSDPSWQLSYGTNHLEISVTSESGEVRSVVIYPYTFISHMSS